MVKTRKTRPSEVNEKRLTKAKDDKRHLWDKAFIGGSLAATFFQGVALGAFIDGIPVVDRQFAGGSLDWLTPFTMFCGVALIVAYALLGCTWLIMKTEGSLQEKMHNLARPLAFVVLAVIGIVSLWTPLAHPEIASRWFTLPNLFWFLPVPILVLVTMYGLIRAVARNAHYTPFLLTLVLIFLGYSGLGISLWPNIIPEQFRSPSCPAWAHKKVLRLFHVRRLPDSSRGTAATPRSCTPLVFRNTTHPGVDPQDAKKSTRLAIRFWALKACSGRMSELSLS